MSGGGGGVWKAVELFASVVFLPTLWGRWALSLRPVWQDPEHEAGCTACLVWPWAAGGTASALRMLRQHVFAGACHMPDM